MIRYALKREVREDLPEVALDGRLGEVCQKYLSFLPRAYAWPALVTYASVLIPVSVDSTPYKLRPQLYTVLVGPVGSGKRTTLKCIANLLGLEEDERIIRVNPDNFKNLVKHLDVDCAPRVIEMDEMAHIMKSMCSQFSPPLDAYVLKTLYYEDKGCIFAARGKKYNIRARLSIIGGVVESDFYKAFAKANSISLYSRFLVGLCPQPWQFQHSTEYLPRVELSPQPVEFDQAELAETLGAEGVKGHDVATIIRIAYICASVDGRRMLRAEHLAPHIALASYLRTTRQILTPPVERTLEV